MPNTNANSALIATVLASAKVGTFTGLIITKKGTQRGPKGAKVTYGDDTVHTVVYTGFKYENLVKKSLGLLDGITDQDIVDEAVAKGLDGIDLATVAQARAELVASFERTLDPAQESTSSTEHVYEPLLVEGEPVRGGRVYLCNAPDLPCKCRNCTGNPKAPLPGTIYLQGLKVWSKVLTPAANGHWKTESAPKKVAKDLLLHRLPVSKYRSFALEPNGPWMLRAGGTAAIEATERGFMVTDDLLAAIG